MPYGLLVIIVRFSTIRIIVMFRCIFLFFLSKEGKRGGVRWPKWEKCWVFIVTCKQMPCYKRRRKQIHTTYPTQIGIKVSWIGLHSIVCYIISSIISRQMKTSMTICISKYYQENKHKLHRASKMPWIIFCRCLRFDHVSSPSKLLSYLTVYNFVLRLVQIGSCCKSDLFLDVLCPIRVLHYLIKLFWCLYFI